MDSAPKKCGDLILIVEDDPEFRDSLTHLLKQEGYEVISVGDGLHAIEHLRWGLRPQAILLDMRMHVMNGWEFRRELSRIPALASIPVLVMSGGPVKKADLAKSAGWLAKPVKKEDLLSQLGRCVAQSKSAAAKSEVDHE